MGRYDGYAFDPVAVRAFGDVFATASDQVNQLAAAMAPDLTSADGDQLLTPQLTRLVELLQAVATDLEPLATHLSEVHDRLNEGTDLVVEAETSAYDRIAGFAQELSGT
jgi:hypothetical protein